MLMMDNYVIVMHNYMVVMDNRVIALEDMIVTDNDIVVMDNRLIAYFSEKRYGLVGCFLNEFEVELALAAAFSE